ncbi:hypothetical protein ACFYYS_05190 [Streptomyces sp. NPDC002120]|uniref:hypothetical protein n=1 Tax=Streptomyces sp. NPDC002120 TaxID=3364631 RepID=UPI0036969047
MSLAVWAFIVMGLGVLMIVLGVIVSLSELRTKTPTDTSRQRELGLSDTIGALAKLAEALREYPLGRFLVAWGTVILLIGGVMGGVSGI